MNYYGIVFISQMIELFKYIAEKYKTLRGVFFCNDRYIKTNSGVVYCSPPPPGKTDYILYIEKSRLVLFQHLFPLLSSNEFKKGGGEFRIRKYLPLNTTMSGRNCLQVQKVKNYTERNYNYKQQQSPYKHDQNGKKKETLVYSRFSDVVIWL